MAENPEEDEALLFRLKYWSYDSEKFSLTSHVEWETALSEEELLEREDDWLTDEPILRKEIRPATDDETDAYMCGFTDGAMVADSNTRLEMFNGVLYALNKTTNADGEIDFQTHKAFTCGVCGKINDFLDVAMVKDYFVATSKEENSALWHVCKDCC